MKTRVLFYRFSALVAVVLSCSQRASADQVILDDLIVDGSACVGFDCVNGESFGFDTVRLKENNVRLHFDDTSNSASFPKRDWRLVANDSSNGGQERFSIEDATASRAPFTIEGSAPSNSLYVEDSGEIGFGTATPVVELHVVDGDTPTLRLEQDGSSGFTPQTWDVAGNETNFFVRDATNGSTLPLRIRPSAATSSIDIKNTETVINENSSDRDFRVEGDNDTHTLFVDAENDRVGIGTSLVETALHVSSTANQIQIEDSDGGQKWRISANGNLFLFEDQNTGNLPFRIEDGAPDDLFTLTAGGAVEVSGTAVHPDYVFEKDYNLLSIEDHAARMWDKKHLPAVGKGKNVDGRGVIDIGSKTLGIIEELEVAHIYIEHLNQQLKAKGKKLAQVESQYNSLVKRLAQLEKSQSKSKAPGD